MWALLHFWPDVPGEILDFSWVDLRDSGNIAENRHHCIETVRRSRNGAECVDPRPEEFEQFVSLASIAEQHECNRSEFRQRPGAERSVVLGAQVVAKRFGALRRRARDL